ncbi:putative membrane protein [Dehalococcoides mccartyi GY50]|nr:putative membrane protein [Dehalococcoides mccartyi GY50]
MKKINIIFPVLIIASIPIGFYVNIAIPLLIIGLVGSLISLSVLNLRFANILFVLTPDRIRTINLFRSRKMSIIIHTAISIITVGVSIYLMSKNIKIVP